MAGPRRATLRGGGPPGEGSEAPRAVADRPVSGVGVTVRAPAVTLRALLFWGMIGIAGTAILGAAAALALTSRLRDQLERSTRAVLEEEWTWEPLPQGAR